MASRESVVIQPDEGKSFWQPLPANGFVELKVSRQDGGARFDCGVQSVATDSFVREHKHGTHEELILVYQGNGKAVVDDQEHPMRPGTVLYLDPDSRHKFINMGDDELRFFWILMPGGLSEFFSAIGRERTPGEPTPESFPRPDNVEQIEADTVFADPRR